MYNYNELAQALKSKLINWLEENRGFVILVFCLPISFLFDLVLKIRNRFNRLLYSAPEKHDERVEKIQTQVKNWNLQPVSQRRPMCTSRPNWLSLSTTFFEKSKCHQISIDLFDILSLDEANLKVRVEPLVSVHDVTKFLIPKGYTLAVTLEIGDATCGGLALAVGMTTHSHKVGLYQETVSAYDVVLADGSLVRATATNEHSDLFYALPWSHGTLGFLVAVELNVIRIKPYVKLRYIPVNGKRRYCQMIRDLSGALDGSKKVPDYLEATVFSQDQAVVMINRVAKWYKPWFYKHVESFLTKGEQEELIPMQDYLLRHNRAIFWVMESMLPFGNNAFFRLLFGWLCPAKPAFLKFTTTPGIRAMTFTKQVFQDIVLPMTVLEDSINLTEKLFDTFPLLIYPCRIFDHGVHSGQLRPPREDQMTPGAKYGMFYDLGVYGTPGKVKRKEKYDSVYAMRKMEKYCATVLSNKIRGFKLKRRLRFIRTAGGYSFLYADIFMTENEFNEMFDLTLYNKVRSIYGAVGAFPTLYEKVKPEIDVFEIGNRWAQHGI